MEYKRGPAFLKAVEGRSVTGVFAVHGNVDEGQDRSHPGSFAKTIQERAGRIKFLWSHDLWGGPPIAVIEELREVTREELPMAVLALAPEATGGVEVTRRYLKNDWAERVFEAVAEGACDEMSYGYDPIRMDFEEVDGLRVRNLREQRLWEVSDVVFGMNPATAGSKAKKFSMPLDFLADSVIAGLEALKAGRRNAASDQGRINQIATLAVELGADNVTLLDAAADDEAATQDEGDGKQRRAGAEKTLLAPPLTLLGERLKVWELELSM